MVSSDVGAADRLQLLQMTAKCSTKEELGKGRVTCTMLRNRNIIFEDKISVAL